MDFIQIDEEPGINSINSLINSIIIMFILLLLEFGTINM